MILIVLGLVFIVVGVVQLRNLGAAATSSPDDPSIPGLDRRQTRRLLGIAFVVVGVLVALVGLT